MHKALLDIDQDSAPGPDGFSSAFYISCWDIIKVDLYESVLDFWSGSPLPTSYCASTLVLLPKCAEPVTFSDFRSISLCQVSSKIISKILAKRLSSVLPQIISEAQAGFVAGRGITDNIAMALEMSSYMSKPARGGNMILKLDMRKAFDRVRWSYLQAVLRRFGFCEPWISLVSRLVESPRFSVSLNGSRYGFFQSSRGLRQGDPLSPLLFILSEEPFSRGLSHLVASTQILPFSLPRGTPIVSHLLYADDVLVFLNGGADNLSKLLAFIHAYEAISGQEINPGKSNFNVSDSFPAARVMHTQALSGFQQGAFPFTYLGCPIFRGRTTQSLFSSLFDKVRKKLAGWKGKLLSLGGRMTLIQSVLTSQAIHIFSLLNPPKVVIDKLHSIFAGFFWGDSEFGKRRH